MKKAILLLIAIITISQMSSKAFAQGAPIPAGYDFVHPPIPDSSPTFVDPHTNRTVVIHIALTAKNKYQIGNIIYGKLGGCVTLYYLDDQSIYPYTKHLEVVMDDVYRHLEGNIYYAHMTTDFTWTGAQYLYERDVDYSYYNNPLLPIPGIPSNIYNAISWGGSTQAN